MESVLNRLVNAVTDSWLSEERDELIEHGYDPDLFREGYEKRANEAAKIILGALRSEVVADFDENCETVRVLDCVLSSEPTS